MPRSSMSRRARPDAARRSQLPLRAAACLVLSGASALVLQVVWMRALARCFGSTTQATATVLAAFMVGLALGSAIAARIADRMARSLRAYAAVELGVALLAVVSLPAIDAVAGPAAALAGEGARGLVTTFAASLVVLLPPTILMGATLPLLAPLVARGDGPTLELLYGANTLGAAAGALASAFFLAPQLGFRRTLWIAATMNVFAALLALATTAGPEESEAAIAEPGGEGAPRALAPLARGAVLLFLATSGGATMVYEIVLSRLAAMLFGSSVHSFALTLVAFLTGIGAGGLLARRLASRSPHVRTGALAARALPAFATASALAAALTSLAVAQLPRLSYELHHLLASRHPSALKGAELVAMFLVMLPPALLMGATFPLALAALVRGREHGAGVGVGTAVNTAGACAGAVAAGFWLVPLHGLESVFEGATCAVALSGALVAAALPGSPWAARRKEAIAARGATAFCAAATLLLAWVGPGWYREALADGAYLHFERYDNFAELQADLAASKLVFDRDGAAASVAVFQHGEGRHLSLHINGKPEASTYDVDVQTQYLLGHLPAMLHEKPERVLLIGLGSAATAHAIALHPTVTRLDVAEIEPAVVEAAGYFEELNGGVLHDPHVAIHRMDGRRLVRSAPDASFDIVVSEPSNPWIAGVADLFTQEHFTEVRRVLAPGGILAQWVQGYSLSPRWLVAVLRTMRSVFPELCVWFSNSGDFLVLASERPLVYDLDRVRRLLEEVPALADELDESDVFGARGLQSRFLRDGAGVATLVRDAPVLTEDRPLLEFYAPFDLHRTTEDRNWELLSGGAGKGPVRGGPLPAPQEAVEWVDLARTARAVERPEVALEAYREAACLDPLPETYVDWAKYLRDLGRPDLAGPVAAEGLAVSREDLTLAILARDLGGAER